MGDSGQMFAVAVLADNNICKLSHNTGNLLYEVLTCCATCQIQIKSNQQVHIKAIHSKKKKEKIQNT